MTNLIRKMEPDLMVVISYGKIIPEAIYSIPPLGTINLHASLLPRYRGASPIQQSLLNGDSKTGISIQKINHRLDEGNLLLSKEIAIEQEDHYVSLRKKLSELSAEILKEYLDALKQGKSLPEFPQTGEPSFCRKITREQGLIRWHEQSAEEVVNQWRALMLSREFIPLSAKTLKLSGLSAHEWQGGKPGEVRWLTVKKGFSLENRSGEILEIQPENKKNGIFRFFKRPSLENRRLSIMKEKKPKSLYFAYFKHLAFTLILFVVLIVGLSLAFYSYFKYTDEEVAVPDLSGLTVLDAVNLLQEKGLKSYIITQTSENAPLFSVLSQQTLANPAVKKGREIVFTVSVGPAWMEFPDFRGKNS